MIYRKSVVIKLIASILIICIAVIIQVLVNKDVSSFIVAVLLGIATGIIVSTIDCLQKNNYELDRAINEFEHIVCHILSCVYGIANADISDDSISVLVDKNLGLIFDYEQDVEKVVEEFNKLLIFPCKESKIKEILSDMNKIFSFIHCEYCFSSIVEKHIGSEANIIEDFEAMKAIRFMRRFDVRSILSYLQKSKHNTIKSLNDENSFFYIIFKQEFCGKPHQQVCDDMEKENVDNLLKKYKGYDISKVKKKVDEIPIPEWNFSSYSKKTKHKKLYEEYL